MDAARYLQVYDIDTIYSWTPRQFKNFIKGAQLHETDLWEREAAGALFTASASNSKKKVRLKDLYDGDKMRNQILSVEGKKEPEKYLGFYNRAKAAMKNYRPQNGKKGG